MVACRGIFCSHTGDERQFHISLRDEFDEHDCDGTKYIVLLDDGYPVATCRFYELNEKSVVLGRLVVLPEYRGKSFGLNIWVPVTVREM